MDDQTIRFFGHQIGLKLIEVLGLEVKANGRVDTSIGDKTPMGLTRTIKSIIEDMGKLQK